MNANNNIDEIVREFGERFRGRIEDWRLSEALKYVDFNECNLAFEVICDDICEYNVKITKIEFDEIIEIGKIFEIDWHSGLMSYLKKLTDYNEQNS